MQNQDDLTHAVRKLAEAASSAHMHLPALTDTEAISAYASSKKAGYAMQKAVITHSCAGDSHAAIHGIAIFLFGGYLDLENSST